MAAYNCEFCGQSIIFQVDSVHFQETHFHSSCFRAALKGLAKVADSLLPKEQKEEIEAIFTESRLPTYVVIMNPESTAATRPRKVFPTLAQAMTVAKKLAAETGQIFWVMTLIGSAKPVE